MRAARVGRPTIAKPLWRDVPFDVTMAILLAISAAGLAAWVYQINEGLVVTGMRDVVTWGLYITFFMFFVGLSAGGLIVASAGTIFGVERLRPLSRLAIWVSLVSVMLAAFFIIPDMGRPERVWHLFRYPSWSSPLIWDVVIIGSYGFISLLYLGVHSREALARAGARLPLGMSAITERAREIDRRVIMGIAYMALPAAIALHSITAWIFGLQFARPYWFTGIMAPLFITSALVSGLGLLLVIMLIARRMRAFDVPNSTISWLGGLLAVFIVADFFMLFAEFLTRQWSQEPDAKAPTDLLMTGKYMWVFWSEVALGIVAFAMMLAPRFRARPELVASAAALAVVSIFLKRLGLVLAGFYYPLVGWEPGIPLGEVREATGTGVPTISSFAATGTYAPTWVEYTIIIGLLALGAALIIAGLRALPLREEQAEEAGPAGGREP